MCSGKREVIYAGYDINELAGKATYEEIVYLLWHGALPNRAELDELKAKLGMSVSFLAASWILSSRLLPTLTPWT